MGVMEVKIHDAKTHLSKLIEPQKMAKKSSLLVQANRSCG
jgi:hypothetical protein